MHLYFFFGYASSPTTVLTDSFLQYNIVLYFGLFCKNMSTWYSFKSVPSFLLVMWFYIFLSISLLFFSFFFPFFSPMLSFWSQVPVLVNKFWFCTHGFFGPWLGKWARNSNWWLWSWGWGSFREERKNKASQTCKIHECILVFYEWFSYFY